MNKRPLAIIAIFFVLGIALARFLPDPTRFPRMAAITLIFILASFISYRYRMLSNIFLFLSVASLAALLYVNSSIYPNNHIGDFLGEETLKTGVVGIIKSPALSRKPYYGKINSTYLFYVEAIKAGGDTWFSVEGMAQIRIQTEKDYRYGDRLLVRGTIKKPKKGVSFNYREYLQRQNIFAVINTKEDNVRVLSYNYRVNPVLRYSYLIRERLKNQIIKNMPLETGSFLRAILLGDRSELSQGLKANFKNSGTMHILAISGLHVGLIALSILYLLKSLRIKRELTYIVTILFLIIFVLLTLSRPSVTRAVVMACIFLVGMLLGRRVDAYNSLGVAALFILVRNPKDLFNVGFQLSFFAVFSILYLVPKFMKIIRGDVNFYLRKFLYMPLAVSVAAWLGTFPLILYYFRIVTPVAIIANLFIIPLLFLLLMGGLSFILLGWVPFLGAFLAGFNDICGQAIFKLATAFASLRFGHFHF
ncbi:MAG: ComEC/Rec2 family competence protein [Candidatus Omnitrophica bacterium]|nr:ComEC/Rec2 family competence protein [Candidatus Omnitrophota bacterium]